MMRLFDFFRRPRGIIAEPGEPIEFSRHLRARVWDVFIEGRSRTEIAVFCSGEHVVRLADLPLTMERFRVEALNDKTIRVVIVPTSDDEFLGHHSAWETLSCTPLRSHDFRGLALAGPLQLSYSGAMTSADLFSGKALPAFVVAGHYAFAPQDLRALRRDPQDAIEIVIENEATGNVTRQSLNAMVDGYEYHAVGINRSPAPQEPWEDSSLRNADFTSMGGYFNIPLGLDVTDPGDSTYRLFVHAECEGYISNKIIIEISA